MMKTLSLPAHAKLNLHLAVGRRNQSGYHSLHTLFQEISLHDTLRFTLTGDSRLKLTVNGRSVPAGEGNLVLKALKRLRRHMRTNQGLRVSLTKKIPIGAGLGGGSSDAATALWGGWLLWGGKNLAQFRRRIPNFLYRLGRELGADVPFFIRGGRSWATGIGDRLGRSLPVRRAWYVLAVPRVHVATKKAYQLLDRERTLKRASVRHVGRSGRFFNSFEPVIAKRYPLVGRTLQILRLHGGRSAMMSGSGSAVFAPVRSQAEGRALSRRVPRRWAEVFLVAAKGI